MRAKETVLLHPVSTQRASEAIFKQIWELIMAGKLKPGDKLPSERTLMEMLHRSRPTIREALRLLESAELIHITPGSGGATVMEPSDSSVKHALENLIAIRDVDKSELLEYRKLNEIAAAGWAAQRRTPEDLENLYRCAKETDWDTIAADKFVLADFGFREILVQAGHNHLGIIVDSVLHRLVYDLLQTSFLGAGENLQQQIRKKVIESHFRICKAIEEQDSTNAERFMCQHIEIFSVQVDNA